MAQPLAPRPVEVYEIHHPAVPASLEGLRILHLTDLHVERRILGHPSYQRLRHAVAGVRPDLVAMTGDWMTKPGQESAAIDVLRDLTACYDPPLGWHGIFGNHDSAELVRRAPIEAPRVNWMINRTADPRPDLRIVGLSYPEDVLGALLDAGPLGEGRFGLVLAHYPTEVIPASSFGLHLVLTGHTHGGQFRVHRRLAPHTSCEMPSCMAAGGFRLGETIVCVSRGLGEAVVPVRINCSRQAPLYVLRRGAISVGGRGAAPAAGPTIGGVEALLTW